MSLLLSEIDEFVVYEDVLRHDGLLHDITEGRRKGNTTRGRRRLEILMI